MIVKGQENLFPVSFSGLLFEEKETFLATFLISSPMRPQLLNTFETVKAYGRELIPYPCLQYTLKFLLQ